jgi:signal peptidase I
VYNLYYSAGSQYIKAHPKKYGEVLWRPVDRRENYVKRCVGLPGDTLRIVNTQVMVNGKAIPNPEDMQLNYYVQTTGPYITEDMFRELGISRDDQHLVNIDEAQDKLATLGLDNRDANGKMFPIYDLPLTKKMYATLEGNKRLVHKIIMEPEDPWSNETQLYPLNLYKHWDRNNYGPIWIPAKGATITLTDDNLPIYERCIRAYEGNKLEVKDDGIYINGKKTNQYTFKMDYYWMMGDNRHNSADSRYWGFVPEDHIVGKPIVVWLSLDKDRGWFDGKIRWSRIFKWVD